MEFNIKGFLETSFVDWTGKVASVIFLPNCNFRCPYCHNYKLVLSPEQLETISLNHILERLQEFKGWIDGCVITGGEPTLYKNLPELLKRIKEIGFLVKLDTNGTNPALLKELIDTKLIDAVSMDVKAPLDNIRYSRCAGVPINLANINKSIQILMDSDIDYEFRITVVPTLLKKEDVLDLAYQIRGAKKLKLQNFNPSDPLDPALKEVKPYSDEDIEGLQEEVNQILSEKVLRASEIQKRKI